MICESTAHFRATVHFHAFGPSTLDLTRNNHLGSTLKNMHEGEMMHLSFLARAEKHEV